MYQVLDKSENINNPPAIEPKRQVASSKKTQAKQGEEEKQEKKTLRNVNAYNFRYFSSSPDCRLRRIVIHHSQLGHMPTCSKQQQHNDNTK